MIPSTPFENLAMKHLEKNQPDLARELKRLGEFEEEVKARAEQASDELADRIQRGEQLEAAKQDVIRTYLQPEEPID